MHALAAKGIGAESVFDREIVAALRTAKGPNAEIGHNEDSGEGRKGDKHHRSSVGDVGNQEGGK